MLRTQRNDVYAENEYSKKKLLNRHSEMLVMLRTPRNDVSAENEYSKKKLLNRHSEMLEQRKSQG